MGDTTEKKLVCNIAFSLREGEKGSTPWLFQKAQVTWRREMTEGMESFCEEGGDDSSEK